jgi:hypothetical protein
MAGGDKYVEYPGGAKMEQEYYRLREDPHELENTYRSAVHNQIEKLRERLKALKNCLKAGCREAEDLSTRPTSRRSLSVRGLSVRELFSDQAGRVIWTRFW